VVEIQQGGTAADAMVVIRCAEPFGAAGVLRGVDLALRLGHTLLIVDLGAREGVDADLLDVLHRSARRVREAGGRLEVVCLDSRLRRLLDLTLLSRSFRVYSTREEALAG
jgi:anti-anti-sigma regulatory factor